MTLTVFDIEPLFAACGGEQYTDGAVAQLEHVLQTAALGEAADARDAMVAAGIGV